jgi:hypothetical protein
MVLCQVIGRVTPQKAGCLLSSPLFQCLGETVVNATQPESVTLKVTCRLVLTPSAGFFCDSVAYVPKSSGVMHPMYGFAVDRMMSALWRTSRSHAAVGISDNLIVFL